MSVISKQLAKEISFKITQSSKKLFEDAVKEFNEAATEIYRKTIPEDVMLCFKKHSDFIETASGMYVELAGFSGRTQVPFGKGLPSRQSSYFYYEPTKAAQEKLIPLKKNMDNLKSSYEKLREETENALLALKTFKNIREELPQAAKYLPPPMSNALVVNFDSLQKKLKAQPDIKKITALSTN